MSNIPAFNPSLSLNETASKRLKPPAPDKTIEAPMFEAGDRVENSHKNRYPKPDKEIQTILYRGTQVPYRQAMYCLDKLQDLLLTPSEGKTVYLPYADDLKSRLAGKLGKSQKLNFTQALEHLLDNRPLKFRSFVWSKHIESYDGGKQESAWHLQATSKDKPVKEYEDLKKLYQKVFKTSKTGSPAGVPKGEEILKQMAYDYLKQPSDNRVIYQPMELKNKKFQPIEYDKAQELLEKTQAVYFQPRMWTNKRLVPYQDGFKVETDGYFHLENLGEIEPRVLGYQDPKAKALPHRGETAAPTKVSSFEDLQKFWQIEKLSQYQA